MFCNQNIKLEVILSSWLATVDAYTSCISKNMLIYDGNSTITLSLHPPARPKFEHENAIWIEDEDVEIDLVKTILSIEK